MKLSLTVPVSGYYRKSTFLISLLAMLFFCNCVFAQTDAVNVSSGKFKSSKSDDGSTIICIQASIDFANIHESYDVPGGYYSGYKSKVGFNAGVFAAHSFLPIGPGQVAAMAGLEFIQKGGTYGSGTAKENWRLNYIELPIDALYQMPVMDNSTVFAGFGPYFAYGIGGKIKYSDGSPSDNAFGGQNGFKHFDFGLQFLGGFRLSGMASISLSYDLGLLSVSGSNYSNQFKDKNGVFSINLAYCLGSK
jgi:outer membrane protein with beta-barrel domain